MNDRTLPHDPYIDAVTDALTAVGLDVGDTWTSAADTRGLHCILNAVLTLEESGLDAERWPEGLLLIWEWHPGREEGEAERGPVWLWAKKLRDGSNSDPAVLPVDGYANPAQVAASAGELATAGQAVKHRPGQWHGSPALVTAITAWETSR
ncbi:hypothetical protein OHB04_02555 [Streptomyces sp. NBC_01775]|uniref:hypothetical protein n=1 Tax=Streptomyces sp. NBC_01775 TaxID=2975939 RepID=UPI002DD7A694|nr:hypothetical protein [Streptomyces sp. NBC_01775]WSB74774.1 hypothetical protein OHB04_02555 [Streptomyces sp. NBC_01775]